MDDDAKEFLGVLASPFGCAQGRFCARSDRAFRGRGWAARRQIRGPWCLGFCAKQTQFQPVPFGS